MIRILALGNSLTEGFGLPPGRSLVDELERSLKQRGYGCSIINAGISGDTTAGALQRLDGHLGEPFDIVMVELGINDALLEYPIEEIRENLSMIIEKCLDIGARVLLVGVDIPEEFEEVSPGYNRQYSHLFHDLAERFHIPVCPHLLTGIAGNPRYTLFDLLHPNERGVEKMAERILPHLERLIKEVQKHTQTKVIP